jgi:hypothetical protein
MSQEASMSQVTIRGVDAAMGRVLKSEARRRKTSVNRTVLALIREAMGQAENPVDKKRAFDDLDHLAGTWKEKDAAQFLRALADQRAIDDEMWP